MYTRSTELLNEPNRARGEQSSFLSRFASPERAAKFTVDCSDLVNDPASKSDLSERLRRDRRERKKRRIAREAELVTALWTSSIEKWS